MDCSPPGSSVHEIFQARILEWVAISFSRESSQPRDQSWVFCTAGRFFTYLSYKGSGLLWLPPGEFPNARTEPRFPALQADSLLSKPPGKPKAGGGDGIPAEQFQILKEDAVKVLHSVCQQIWKTQQCLQDWKRSVFILVPKKSIAKECSKYCTVVLISHTSMIMLKILETRLQQYMN